MPPKPVSGDYPWSAKILAWLGVAINDDGSLKPEAVAAAGGSATDPEVVRDTIAAALVAGSNITITVDDVGNTIGIAATGGGSSVGSIEGGAPDSTYGGIAAIDGGTF